MSLIVKCCRIIGYQPEFSYRCIHNDNMIRVYMENGVLNMANRFDQGPFVQSSSSCDRSHTHKPINMQNSNISGGYVHNLMFVPHVESRVCFFSFISTLTSSISYGTQHVDLFFHDQNV